MKFIDRLNKKLLEASTGPEQVSLGATKGPDKNYQDKKPKAKKKDLGGSSQSK